jgi:hypothetical protein
LEGHIRWIWLYINYQIKHTSPEAPTGWTFCSLSIITKFTPGSIWPTGQNFLVFRASYNKQITGQNFLVFRASYNKQITGQNFLVFRSSYNKQITGQNFLVFRASYNKQITVDSEVLVSTVKPVSTELPCNRCLCSK